MRVGGAAGAEPHAIGAAFAAGNAAIQAAQYAIVGDAPAAVGKQKRCQSFVNPQIEQVHESFGTSTLFKTCKKRSFLHRFDSVVQWAMGADKLFRFAYILHACQT